MIEVATMPVVGGRWHVDSWQDLQWLLWVGLALLLGAVEVASLDLVFAMLAAAALAAGVSAVLGVDFPFQVITFAVAAGALLAVVRPLVIRKIRPAIPFIRTNADAHAGRLAEVLEAVDGRSGRVKLAGEVWSARTTGPGEVLPAGADAEVVRIDGATAVVRALPTVGPPRRPDPDPGPPDGPPGPTPSPWSAP